MAIYHFSGTMISRSQGRSVIACAAYRAGEKLFDERYQKTQDYSKRQDVVYDQLLTPANFPEWAQVREKLWNEVERVELRKDAQLAREFNFALPKELSLEENIKLAEEFTKEAFVARGMVADLAIHVDYKSDGAYYHAHVMLTTRAINEQGFGQKVRNWNSKDLLLKWREQWAEYSNRYLALNDHDLKIDHRTLVEQQIALEPQHKIGPVGVQEQLAKLADHQRIARENGERLLADPQIALKAITHQQSTFSYQDLARFVHRHTVDAEQFTRVYELVKSQSNIVKLGLDDRQQERYTTQEMLDLEVKMLNQARDLFTKKDHPVTTKIDLAHFGLSAEQQTAFEYLIAAGDLKCVIGYAGTGKSYLLGAAKDAWEQQGFRVQGVTLSGIAAESLEGGSGINSRTLASRSYYWDRGEQLLNNKDILVVDEAGMLGSRQVARIVDEVTKSQAKLVIVMDPQQLQAIEAGAAGRAICERVNFVELTEIRRQKAVWQQAATKEFAEGQVKEALDRYLQANHIHEADTKALAKSQMINMWNDVRLQNPENSQIMLAYTRADVQDLNELARNLRQQQGELGQDTSFKTFRGDRNFAIYDRVYFLKNDRNLGVMNGSLGTIEQIDPKAITIRLDPATKEPGRSVVVDLDLYNHLDHGYAATIHKSQGITIDRSYLLASKYLDAHATYVSMSRHRASVDLFYSRDEFPKYNDLVNSLAKDRAKDVSLDYVEHDQLAYSRGLESDKQQDKKQEQQAFALKQNFPFRNKFSNLLGFKDHDQAFKELREELTKKFAELDPHELKKQFETAHVVKSNFDFDYELNKVRTHKLHIEQQINQRKVNCSEYSIVKPQEVVRGIVGKNLELPNGKQMIEIIQDKDLPTKLVPEHHFIKIERGKEVELKFDEKGAMANIKNSQTLQKEALIKQQQEENLKIHLGKMQDLSKDRGFER